MSGFLKELVSFNVYKSSQGRICRRLTFIGFSLVFLLWGYSIYRAESFGVKASTITGAVVALLGIWASFRAINYPTFADFLVSVEAEMSKVSWPSKQELYVSTRVVLIFMVLFTVLIFLFDVIYGFFFGLLR